MLDGVGEIDPETGTISEQTFEARLVFRRGDDEDVADARQHEHADRIIHHRFVVHAEELFGNAPGDRVKTRARATCQNNAFHVILLFRTVPSLEEQIKFFTNLSKGLCENVFISVFAFGEGNIQIVLEIVHKTIPWN